MMIRKSKTYDVFVCYANSDSKVGREVCSALYTANISFITNHSDNNACINTSDLISQSKLFLFLGSQQAFKTHYTKSELKYALNESSVKPVIYILNNYEDASLLGESSNRLCSISMSDYPIGPELTRELNTILGKDIKIEADNLQESKEEDSEEETSIKIEDDYDIFISCKSIDYSIAEKLYEYLTGHGFSVFLSSKELRKLGNAEYNDAISAALNSAYHMILVTSSFENTMSKWVKFEWQTFHNEMLSDRKNGKIITLLHGMKVEELPIQLRSYETFTLADYDDRILKYVETPKYKARKDSEKAEELERKKKNLAEIAKKESEFEHLQSQMDVISKQIIELRKKDGIVEKSCPICGAQMSLDSRFCSMCGISLTPVHAIFPSIPWEQKKIMKDNLDQLNTFCRINGRNDNQDK